MRRRRTSDEASLTVEDDDLNGHRLACNDLGGGVSRQPRDLIAKGNPIGARVGEGLRRRIGA